MNTESVTSTSMSIAPETTSTSDATSETSVTFDVAPKTSSNTNVAPKTSSNANAVPVTYSTVNSIPETSTTMSVVPETTSSRRITAETSSVTDAMPVALSAMNPMSIKGPKIEKNMYSAELQNCDEMITLPNLEFIEDEFHKFVEPRLASLVVTGSSQVQIDMNFHFHSKEEGNKLKDSEGLGKEINKQKDMGTISNDPDIEYEYVPYIPSSLRKDEDAFAVLHGMDSSPKFQSLSFDPKISENNDSKFSSLEQNTNTNTFFMAPPEISNSLALNVNPSSVVSPYNSPLSAPPLSHTQSSENFSNAFSQSPGKLYSTPKTIIPRCEILDYKKTENIPPQKCEISDDRREDYLKNISNERCEVKNLEWHEEINTNLIPWPNKFIECNNFTLGIIPGEFFQSSKGYFVKLFNGAKYKILVGNNNGFSCDVDVYVDNILVIRLRLRPGKSTIIEGPRYRPEAFVYLRAQDAPDSAKITPKQESNGLIRAVFLPEKLERTRAMSEPASFSGNMNNILDMLGISKKIKKPRAYTTAFSGHGSFERGFDLAQFCEGATALQGKQAPKNYEKVEEIEINHEGRVELSLRLISRTDDLNIPCSEEISCLHPPPIWSLS